jgi:GAF domain-containing protein
VDGTNFDQVGFLGELSRCARLLLTSYDVDETLQELTDTIRRRLSLKGAAISLAEDGVLRCVSAAPSLIRDLEAAQTLTREGPCYHAFEIGEPVLVPQLDREPFAWPGYREHAERHSIQAIAGIPLVLADASIGVMNLYSSEPHDWTIPEVESLVTMADMATAYLVNASTVHQQTELTQQLQKALDSRVLIEQAKGMVGYAHTVSMDVAFARIQRHARSHHTSVRTVADAVVNLGLQL